MSRVVFEANKSKLRQRVVMGLSLGALMGILLVISMGLSIFSILVLLVCVYFMWRALWRLRGQLKDGELIVLAPEGLFDRSYGLGLIPWDNIRAARLHRVDRLLSYEVVELVLNDLEVFFNTDNPDRKQIKRGLKNGLTGIWLNTWQLNASAEEVLDAIRDHINLYSEDS